jgi:hypothetical protein
MLHVIQCCYFHCEQCSVSKSVVTENATSFTTPKILTSIYKRLNQNPAAAPQCNLHTFHHLLTQHRCMTNSEFKLLEICTFIW